MRILQDMLEDLPFEDLPPAWVTLDLAAFSKSKRLWDYQQEALQYALKALWKYYEDFANYHVGEPLEMNAARKERFWRWYQDNGLDEDLSIPLAKQKRDIRRLLEEYYPPSPPFDKGGEGARGSGGIPYQHFINRISFWMATGSGKTLVLVKLLELLWRLMRAGEVPQHDVLVLTARDDLLAQLKAHVDEFNAMSPLAGGMQGGQERPYIRLWDLKAYPEVKWGAPSLFREQELTVFVYRSDNLSDQQKERIIDFRNYDNEGRWYVLLDEAHKGDKEDSKRQHIYSILSRNGFLFNFSATFTDPRDILTTAYDFNLARFVEAGYGKHITILKQENRAFKDKEDYTGEEKQRVVLKALLMLAYVRKAHLSLPPVKGKPESISLPPMRGEPEGGPLSPMRGELEGGYHRPLLLTLVNSVNTQDADLKLFFHELERIGRGEIAPRVWEQAREELWAELVEGPGLLFEGERFQAGEVLLHSLTPAELLSLVYNAPGPGAIEVLLRPSNRKEMAFKLKSAERPFALIKIGDISRWLKEELAGYEVVEGFEDESFFQQLNEDDSDINILMGSRSFYEGWDSNRPNVITFINIGTGVDAKKFILQSVGRGVRIEPFAGQRKRLLALYNARVVDEERFRQLRDHVLPLETLFIFGTNRKALHTVIQQLDQEKRKEAAHELALEVNQEVVGAHPLLIPVYREARHTLLEARAPRKFEIAEEELDLLRRYVAYLRDERLLLAHHSAAPQNIRLLQRCLEDPTRYFNTTNGRRFGRLDLILLRLFDYFQVVPQELERLKPLGDEIHHFRHIKVFLKDISQLQADIERVKGYRDPTEVERALKERFQRGEIDLDAYTAGIKQAARAAKESRITYRTSTLEVRYIANHYYVPVILSHDEKVDYIRHIIRHPSEVRFLNHLDRYLQGADNGFQTFDWWLFSKLDETLDEVYIPYYDPNLNRIRRFNPDFIFWLQRGSDYFLVFVDPKGMQQAAYEHKVDGFKQLYRDETGTPQTFSYNGLTVRFFLLLYTEDANRAPSGYREHWFDDPATIPAALNG